MTEREIDEATGTETTGHEWDGIKELNTPLPRWWLWVFYATIIWSVFYWVLMPAWPTLSGYTPGLLEHSQRADVAKAVDALRDARSDKAQALAAASLPEIVNDPDLLAFAMAAGRSAFGDNCATCHGSGAQGAVGYPNLNDDAWIWGGRLEDITLTLQHGIRSDDPDTRLSMMPAFGRDDILPRDQIEDLASYVVSLSGREADPAAVERAAPVFAEQCAICHGEDGKGIRELGAPNLTDADWLYQGSREAILAQINNPQHGVMPAWGERLDGTTLRALAFYVHSLSGGE